MGAAGSPNIVSVDEPTSAPFVAELRALAILAGPLGLAQAGQAMLGVVDTAVVGRLNPAAVGGVGLGNGIFFAVATVGMGVMYAFDPLIAQALGAKEPGTASRMLRQGVWASAICTAVLAPLIVGLVLSLESFGVKPHVAEAAREFLYWRLPQLPALFLFSLCRGWLQAQGTARALFIAMVAANFANWGLDVLLVFGGGPIPSMGPAGAGFASSISGWLQVAALWWFVKRTGAHHEDSRRADREALGKAFKLGTPIGLQMLAEYGVFTLVGIFAGRLGENESAAHVVALTVASFSFSLAVGIGGAVAARVGHSVGAKDHQGARRRGLAGLTLGVLWMGLSSLSFLVFPHAIARVMTDKPEVIAVTVALFGVAAVFQISDGLQAVGAGALRGVGDARVPFIANLIGHWAVGLPVALWLGNVRGLGLVGYWWGLSVGLTVVALALVTRFVVLTRREIQRI
ncbi:MAG: MATE family efflux transporter [Myxococcaceae bacterium]